MNLHFQANVPQWLKIAIRREARKMKLEWRGYVRVGGDEVTEGRKAFVEMQSEYRVADFTFDNSLRNDLDALQVVRHELFHLVFAPIQKFIEDSIPKKFPGRTIIIKNVDNLIETAIESILKMDYFKSKLK